MKKPTVLAILLACAAAINPLAAAPPFMQMDNASGDNVMTAYIEGFLVQAGATRICTRDFQDGTTGKRFKIYPNENFKNYNSKCGAVVTKENRFWLIGGEGTVENKRYQPVADILTGTVKEGVLENLKKVRSLPFPVRNGRALIHENKLYYLGGSNHSELIFADILPDGELGEWKTTLPPYPVTVACGGFVFYKGCFYANGKSTWKPGSSKMFALKLKKDGTAGKWERVESPDEAQGFMVVRNDSLYYFDELSGNIYKTSQDDDGLQLKEWQEAGKMPSPPKTGGVAMTEVPGGWLFYGGHLPKTKDGKFAGFFKPAFLPFSAVK